jgi:hypothetical protein
LKGKTGKERITDEVQLTDRRAGKPISSCLLDAYQSFLMCDFLLPPPRPRLCIRNSNFIKIVPKEDIETF